MTKRRPPDARLAVARYVAEHSVPPVEPGDEEPANPGQPSADQRAQFAESATQQAVRRGEVDGLPGAGNPLPALGGVRDPPWWIRRKIEREHLTGLGPPALMLRTEDAGLDDRLDRLPTESAVREALEDFNARGREGRGRLPGGPPGVPPPRG